MQQHWPSRSCPCRPIVWWPVACCPSGPIRMGHWPRISVVARPSAASAGSPRRQGALPGKQLSRGAPRRRSPGPPRYPQARHPRARCTQRLRWPPSRCWHRPRGPGPGPLPAGWCRSGAADKRIDQDQRNGPGHVRCHESGQMRPGLGHPALGEQRDARRQHRPRRRHRRPPEPFHPLLVSRCRERPFPPAHAGHHPIASPGRRTPSPADPDGEAGRTPDADLPADPASTRTGWRPTDGHAQAVPVTRRTPREARTLPSTSRARSAASMAASAR